MYSDDHKPIGVSEAAWGQSNQWVEPEEDFKSGWEDSTINDETGGVDTGGRGSIDRRDDSYEDSEDSDNERNSSAKSSKDLNGNSRPSQHRSSRQSAFADNAAKAAIMGIESGKLNPLFIVT